MEQHYYGDYCEGYHYDDGNYHMEVWCEICGEPHHTHDCYYSPGCPTDFNEEPYPYSQPLEAPNIPPSQLDISTGFLEYWEQRMECWDAMLEKGMQDIGIPLSILDTRESEEQLRRLEAQSIVINELCANYRRGSLPCYTNDNIYWDDEDEINAPQPSSFVVLEQTQEPETIMDKVQLSSPQSTAKVPPPVRIIPSWEDEFGDELSGIRLMEVNEEEFDPVGDIIELEALLFGKPIVEVNKAPHQEENLQVSGFTNKPMTMVTSDSLPCNKECPTMDEHDGGSPPKSKIPRERAWRKPDQPLFKAYQWSYEHIKSINKCRDDRLLHYINCIRFGPGKFKCWWHDPFIYFF